MTRKNGVRGWWLATGLAWFGLSTACLGQSIGVDPYDPWNAMYRPFVFPGAVPNSAIPNQSRIGIIGNGNRNSDFSINNPDPGLDPARGFGGRFVPYYLRSYRRGDGALGSTSRSAGAATGRDRSYMANRGDTFYEKQQVRDQKFFEALRERDPRRKAELMRQLNQEKRTAARPSTTSRVREPGPSAGRRPAPSEAAEPPAAAPAIDPALNELLRPGQLPELRPGLDSSGVFMDEGREFEGIAPRRIRPRMPGTSRSGAGGSGSSAPSELPNQP